MTPLIKANYNGLKVPAIKEEGFTPEYFSGKAFDAYAAILDPDFQNFDSNQEDANTPDDFNTKVGVKVGGNDTRHADLVNKKYAFPEDKIEIGSTRKISYTDFTTKGSFCEKPTFLPHGSSNTPTFFPLGCNGSGASLSDASKGFNTRSYYIGGKTPLNQDSICVPINGTANTDSFDPDFPGYANYKVDKECISNFFGSFPTNAHEPLNNLLKYPEASTETQEATLTTRQIYGYPLPEYKTISSISVYVNDVLVERDTDYTVSAAGYLLFTSYLPVGTRIKIVIHRHNYWEPCWDNKVASNINPTAFTGNFLSAEDCMDVNPVMRTSDCTFIAPITITEDGYYTFSTWCRLNSENVAEKTYVAGLHFATNSSLSLIDASQSHYVLTDATRKTTQESTYNTFEVSTKWSRIAKTSYLTAGNYFAAIKWRRADLENTEGTLRFAGMLVEKSKAPSTYDNRQVSYTYFDNQFTTSAHPLIFAFSGLLTTSEWTIAYSRYIFDNALSDAEHYDSIGDITYGYKGQDIVVNGESIDGISAVASDFYNRWERVLLEYKASLNYIKMTVTRQGIDSEDPEKEYSLNISLEGHELERTIHNVAYQLMLGSTLDDNALTFYNGCYKNVWWIPYVMTDAEKHDFLYKALEVSEDICETSRTYVDFSGDEPEINVDSSEENNVILRSVYLEEAND